MLKIRRSAAPQPKVIVLLVLVSIADISSIYLFSSVGKPEDNIGQYFKISYQDLLGQQKNAVLNYSIS